MGDNHDDELVSRETFWGKGGTSPECYFLVPTLLESEPKIESETGPLSADILLRWENEMSVPRLPNILR